MTRDTGSATSDDPSTPLSASATGDATSDSDTTTTVCV
jgi:hypothetical protein